MKTISNGIFCFAAGLIIASVHSRKIDQSCNADEFDCKNNICITNSWKCDGENDCEDGSDEDPKLCSDAKHKYRCAWTEFACKTSKTECIPMSWVCDRHLDCTDGSDEAECDKDCRSDEFTCANGRCIRQSWICDGEDDCGDGSDETNCSTKDCDREYMYLCSDRATCIHKEWLCDGDADCPQDDDEDESMCRSTTHHRDRSVTSSQPFTSQRE